MIPCFPVWLRPMKLNNHTGKGFIINIFVTLQSMNTRYVDMDKVCKSFSCLFLAFLSAMVAHAYDFTTNGICYNITTVRQPTVEVTYMSLSSEDNYSAEMIEIPKKVKHKGTTYMVTGIGEYAFMGCMNLDSIAMPDSILSIGDYAFAWCRKLPSLKLPSNLKSIGTCAFSGCSSLRFLRIPLGVEFIGHAAFSECSKMAYINIPANVNAIGDYTFGGCSKLIAITIPQDVESIGMEAFSGCKSLKKITIPESVTSIGDFAFSGCAGLKEILLPSSVTYIGNYAFSGCSKLDTISLAKQVATIGDFAFRNCDSLRLIESLNPVAPSCYGRTFIGVDKRECLVHVPEGARHAYMDDAVWGEFAGISEVSQPLSAMKEDDDDDY